MEELLKLVFPSVLVDHFDILKVGKHDKSEIPDIFLELKSNKPAEFSNIKLHSRGFFTEVTIQDFRLIGFKSFNSIARTFENHYQPFSITSIIEVPTQQLNLSILKLKHLELDLEAFVA